MEHDLKHINEHQLICIYKERNLYIKGDIWENKLMTCRVVVIVTKLEIK